jgi:hypothetical protein
LGVHCHKDGASTGTGAAPLCTSIVSEMRPREEIGMGYQNTCLAKSCSGGTIRTLKGMVTGGQNDWFVPSKEEMQIAYDNRAVIGLSVRNSLNYWNSSYGTDRSNYVVPMRTF